MKPGAQSTGLAPVAGGWPYPGRPACGGAGHPAARHARAGPRATRRVLIAVGLVAASGAGCAIGTAAAPDEPAAAPPPAGGPLRFQHAPWEGIEFLAGPYNDGPDDDERAVRPLALDGTVAIVGERALPLADLLKELYARSPELFWKSYEQMIDQAILAQEIARLGITVDEALVDRVWRAFDAETRQAFAQRAAPGERYEDFLLAQLRRRFAYYNLQTLTDLEAVVKDQLRRQHLPYRFLLELEWRRQPWVELRHVLYADESAARAGREKLVDGGYRFAQLARRESRDASAEQGGALGRRFRGELIAPLDARAFTLPIGEVSEPIQSEFGWHLVEVLARHEGEEVSFADLKDTLHADYDPAVQYPPQLAESLRALWYQRYRPKDLLRRQLPFLPGPEGADEEAAAPGVPESPAMPESPDRPAAPSAPLAAERKQP